MRIQQSASYVFSEDIVFVFIKLPHNVRRFYVDDIDIDQLVFECAERLQEIRCGPFTEQDWRTRLAEILNERGLERLNPPAQEGSQPVPFFLPGSARPPGRNGSAVLDLEEAGEERREDRLDAHDDEGQAQEEGFHLGQAAEITPGPDPENIGEDGEPDQDEGQAEKDPPLQGDGREDPFGEAAFFKRDPPGEDLGRHAEIDDLPAQEGGYGRQDHDVDIPAPAEQPDRPEAEPDRQGQAGQEDDKARDDKEMDGRIDEHESDMPPGIPESGQLGNAFARLVRHGDFGDAELFLQGMDHHLAGEFHPGRAQPHEVIGLPAESAQAAMGVRYGPAEQDPQKPGQERVPDMAVGPAHGPGQDRAPETGPDDEIAALAEAIDEPRDLQEIVGVVGIAHDDEAAPGFLDAPAESRSVSPAGFEEQSAVRPPGFDDRDGPVGRTVVDDDHFAPDLPLPEDGLDLVQADADGRLFVQAGQDDRDLKAKGVLSPAPGCRFFVSGKTHPSKNTSLNRGCQPRAQIDSLSILML